MVLTYSCHNRLQSSIMYASPDSTAHSNYQHAIVMGKYIVSSYYCTVSIHMCQTYSCTRKLFLEHTMMSCILDFICYIKIHDTYWSVHHQKRLVRRSHFLALELLLQVLTKKKKSLFFVFSMHAYVVVQHKSHRCSLFQQFWNATFFHICEHTSTGLLSTWGTSSLLQFTQSKNMQCYQ